MWLLVAAAHPIQKTLHTLSTGPTLADIGSTSATLSQCRLSVGPVLAGVARLAVTCGLREQGLYWLGRCQNSPTIMTADPGCDPAHWAMWPNAGPMPRTLALYRSGFSATRQGWSGLILIRNLYPVGCQPELYTDLSHLQCIGYLLPYSVDSINSIWSVVIVVIVWSRRQCCWYLIPACCGHLRLCVLNIKPTSL